MRRIPSMTGLRAFEAAARCGSFVRAGEELGVSSAAVSLQVRSLEEHLGKMLFERLGNRIFLTDAGSELFPRLSHAFDEIAEVTGALATGTTAAATGRQRDSVLGRLLAHAQSV